MSTTIPSPGRAWPLVAGLAVLAVLGQLYGLYRVTGPPTPTWLPNADKLEHAVGFALPVALVLLACGLRARSRGVRLARATWVLVLAVAAAHAPVSEVIQHLFYTGRSGDPLDVLADLVGTAVGTLAAWALLRRDRPGNEPAAQLDRTSATAEPDRTGPAAT